MIAHDALLARVLSATAHTLQQLSAAAGRSGGHFCYVEDGGVAVGIAVTDAARDPSGARARASGAKLQRGAASPRCCWGTITAAPDGTLTLTRCRGAVSAASLASGLAALAPRAALLGLVQVDQPSLRLLSAPPRQRPPQRRRYAFPPLPRAVAEPKKVWWADALFPAA